MTILNIVGYKFAALSGRETLRALGIAPRVLKQWLNEKRDMILLDTRLQNTATR